MPDLPEQIPEMSGPHMIKVRSLLDVFPACTEKNAAEPNWHIALIYANHDNPMEGKVEQEVISLNDAMLILIPKTLAALAYAGIEKAQDILNTHFLKE